MGPPGPAGRGGPRPVRLLPRGGRRDPRRPLRAGRRPLVRGPRPGRHRVREPAAGLGPGRALPRARPGSLPAPARGRDQDHVLRSRELHPGPRAAHGRGAGARRLLRRRGHELARDPPRRRRRRAHRAVDRGRRARPGRDGLRHRPHDAARAHPRVPPGPDRGAARRAVRRRRVAELPPEDGAERPALGPPRPAGRPGGLLRRELRLRVPRVVRGPRRRAPRHPRLAPRRVLPLAGA